MQQDAYWLTSGEKMPFAEEQHFGRVMRCFAKRPAHIDAMFRETVACHGSREALVADGRRFSYAELASVVESLAAHFVRSGLRPGDRVLLLTGNCAEFLFVVLACARIGAISVPVGARLAAQELVHVIEDCRPAAIVFEIDFVDRLPAAKEELRFVIGGAFENAQPIDQLILSSHDSLECPAAEDDTAVLLYTSGTTGRPKGAMLTHIGFVHSAMHFALCMKLNASERTAVAVPVSHVTGLVSLLLTTIYVGGCSILVREFKAGKFLRIAAKECITYTLMVPAMYLLCLKEPELDGQALSSWRIGGFGGSPMPESAIQSLSEQLPSLTLVHAYGATETTSPTTLMPLRAGLEHASSVGQAVPCGEIEIADPTGCALACGEVGEICVRGPMVVPAYWNNAQANEVSFRDGFWRSGDLGSIDTNGFVYVHDRLKDMINRGGYKVFSAEVENVLSSHPDVYEVAVVAVADDVLGERVRAVIFTPSLTLNAHALRSHCEGRLADYKIPEYFDLRHHPLPRNANGKIQKHALKNTT